MNKKNLITLIKTKADEKQIPNFSAQIIEKVENQNVFVKQEVSIIKKTNRFKPLYASLTTVFGLLILFLAFSVVRSNNVDLFADSNFSDSVVLSTIATVNYIEQTEVLALDDSYTILLADEQTDDLIEGQIDDVVSYAKFMEVLLNNGDDYQKEIEKSDIDGYEKMITYKLNNLSDEEMIYQLYYNEGINLNKNTYQVEGLLKYGDNDYQIAIEGSFDEKQYTLTYQHSEQNYIDVNYQVENQNQKLSIMVYKNNVLDQEVAIEYDDYESATLSYMKGQTKGTYQFEIETSDNTKGMKVNYSIGTSDSGSIEFGLSDDDQKGYILNINPDNRESFMMEKERPSMPNHGKGQQNN
ncbi:hypothetical protein [Mariniplasma anaerobium]|uniref:Uncharacterized protein n=1 Tax=Mariniplasma anaerobium TaxID=2735436 RepID=A0A7U9THG4_9MOLU|nr:hypothetical protein [Mariniplasma anaerobium]BCR36424.1 hypothetical protein MPAN_013170 [Mariniplasma anaerobium]